MKRRFSVLFNEPTSRRVQSVSATQSIRAIRSIHLRMPSDDIFLLRRSSLRLQLMKVKQTTRPYLAVIECFFRESVNFLVDGLHRFECY